MVIEKTNIFRFFLIILKYIFFIILYTPVFFFTFHFFNLCEKLFSIYINIFYILSTMNTAICSFSHL